MLEALDFFYLGLLIVLTEIVVGTVLAWAFKSQDLNSIKSLLNVSGGNDSSDEIKNLLKGFEMRQAKKQKKTKKQSTPAPSGGGMMDMVGGLLNNPEVMKMVGSMLSPPPQPPASPPKPKK